MYQPSVPVREFGYKLKQQLAEFQPRRDVLLSTFGAEDAGFGYAAIGTGIRSPDRLYPM